MSLHHNCSPRIGVLKMAEIKRFKVIKCMVCESTSHKVAFGSENMPRIIVNCDKCGCRYSFQEKEDYNRRHWLDEGFMR